MSEEAVRLSFREKTILRILFIVISILDSHELSPEVRKELQHVCTSIQVS